MEEYRQVKDYEGLYEVSNMGNVLSLSRKTKGRWGNMKTNPSKVLKPHPMKTGYLRVGLSKNGKAKNHFVHRLVAQAFVPNPDNLPCVNHIDNNPANNEVVNLEWCTHKQNTDHALKQDRIARGSRVGLSKLTEKQVAEIKSNDTLNGEQLAKKYNVTRHTVSLIKLGKGWTHVDVKVGRKTWSCKRGHPLSESVEYRGTHICKTCMAIAGRAYYQRQTWNKIKGNGL